MKKAEERGADLVTIAGFEVAGHPSPDGIGTIVLANKAARELSIPVIAAGGIADGRGLVAALALGASAVTLGTRFVACLECPIHENFKIWIENAGERDTTLCQQTIHNMVRVADNDAARRCRELEAKGAGLEALMPVISGKISKACYENGDVDGGMFAIGPAVGLITESKSAREIVSDIMTEARSVLSELSGMLK
ncbi:Nitronate monooxygenase [bioreactor metagenome]|uniref:Nitronate monooxygenase n=1 Tax=bioreactor metagenome TaxID=1076179 RepID=A0A645GJA8_9ZZZZ